ncbi:lumenal Hsp70 protein [Yamadazyma tenuis]|uniref:Actin-like ATPase domain-containing protein n=1 Tax=Candida tenuis (strain ATCC 10573 / BCRC 21748 / CBS 615 / JCM 9827 / NBRC 10315 / NRRL Y-1498 / VKM Y-70) TaxID=590646 RepID=G3AXK4_CANTC|nr:uncharacterized protein CANTEDRAFT_128824 [Yamadazyma tenuis ATCC 10573]EGV66406.1 hypothetical protein CANTEDRAFT_128824 [Yamadazyma tenuis ATCC 10573]WEJ95480.1 lumenal Hsp70 protein [Yamadazyma tenuis]
MKFFIAFYLLTLSLAAILGIDYGQQFTKAVMLAPGVQFEILLTEEARRKDLSSISIRPEKNGEIERVYGSAAQSLCTRFPHHCIGGIKSLLGKSFQDRDLSDYLSTHFGLKAIEDEDRTNAIKFDLGFANQSFAFSVEEVLAMTLKELKNRALKNLDENPVAKAIVDDVAISVPPYITQEQRQAYIDALEIAGYKNILGLVDEGTAVAINYASNQKYEQKDYDNKKKFHMIYDMGAGSTKATLFSITPFSNLTTKLELENIGFDVAFGGQALTQSIYNILIEKLTSSFGLDEDFELPPRAAARLLEGAEKAKIILSANSDYHLSLESILDEKDFKAVITREEFEEINIDNMVRITKPIMDALHGTGVSINELQSVILTGGSSRIPFVQKHLATLLGEQRIAKTVNADESCALGTTIKAFREKTSFSFNKDFVVEDKTYHNYEVSVNGEEFSVFEKGTPADSTKRINLGELIDDLSIELFEDGRYFKGYTVENVLDKTSSLTCNDDKAYKKQIFATFTLDSNKIFSFTKLEVECIKEGKDGFFKKFLNKEEPVDFEEEAPEAEENESTNSTASVNATDSSSRKSRKVLRPVSISIPRPQYPSLKPMSRPLKQRVTSKFKYLDSRDEYKIALDNTKNRLEAACYQLRNLIDEHEERISDELSVDNFRELVSETIEWLEFDSDDSPLSEFEDKIRQIQIRHDEIHAITKMSTTDLSLEGMTKLYEEGSSIMMKIQSKMLEFGSSISEIRQKYDKEGLDFDKENDRIKLQLLSKGEDKMMRLDRSLGKYKDLLTQLGETVQLNEKYFNKIAKRELFDTYEAMTESIVQMLADLVMLDESHQERMQLFNTKFEKLVERKKQKEFREKLKQEKANADGEKQGEVPIQEDEDVEHEQTEQTEQTEQETQQQDNNAENSFEPVDEEIVHDEL